MSRENVLSYAVSRNSYTAPYELRVGLAVIGLGLLLVFAVFVLEGYGYAVVQKGFSAIRVGDSRASVNERLRFFKRAAFSNLTKIGWWGEGRPQAGELAEYWFLMRHNSIVVAFDEDGRVLYKIPVYE